MCQAPQNTGSTYETILKWRQGKPKAGDKLYPDPVAYSLTQISPHIMSDEAFLNI